MDPSQGHQQQHQQQSAGHLDFSQDPLLPIDTFDPKSQSLSNPNSATFLPFEPSWPLLVQQNMSQQSHGLPISAADSSSDVRSAISSPMAPLHSPSFDHVEDPATSAPLNVSPQMASSMATLQLAGFNAGVSGAETLQGQTTLDIRTSMAAAMTPLTTADLAFQHAFDASATMLATAQMPFQMLGDQQAYGGAMTFTSAFDVPLHASPTEEFISTSQEQALHGMPLMAPGSIESMAAIESLASPITQFGYHPDLTSLAGANWGALIGDLNSDVGTSTYANPSVGTNSPDQPNFLDSRSFSNRSDGSWAMIDHPRHSLDGYSDGSAVVSPQILHVRTDSNSSQHSDPPLSAHSFGSDEFFGPISPEPESSHSCSQAQPHQHYDAQFSSPPTTQNHTPAVSAQHSPRDTTSSTGSSPKTKRKTSPPGRTSPPGVTAKTISKKKSPSGSTIADKTEKRVGRRRGPLKPEQRQQAHEIRKLRACLRCKFLKKVCDKGDPCGGCQPSHARLWQVPCTRIDIKDIGYFLKEWNADYERHVTLGFSIANIKGFSEAERLLYITHGYGFVMPIRARQVYVADENCFGVDWVESIHENPREYEYATGQLSAGVDGISRKMVSEYIELHLDQGFEHFVDEYFDGTPFISELLKTIHRYYRQTEQANIRKGLKLVIAYALTLHITMVSPAGLSEEEANVGKIDDPSSRYYGQTCAPVMINFQVKKAMADMWRELMKDVLEELSALYSSVYSGEKFKNWPTIFMLIALILSVWEMMQFDCHYRVPDQGAVTNFCNEMENVPVGVIVGLFNAISTKLPGFLEWDTRKHGITWNGNNAICDTMTEVRQHVEKHGSYLKTRNEAKFDRDDFDCLSNKFLSKLVIKAN